MVEGDPLKRWSQACLAALLLSLVAALPARSATSQGFDAPARADRMLLVGDSITYGTHPGGGASFAELLSLEHDVVNVGCGGTMTGHWNPSTISTYTCATPPTYPNLFMARAVPAMPVDFAAVMLGTNDAVWAVSAATYRANMEALVNGLLGAGAERVLIMTPPPYPIEAGGTPARMLRLQGYRDQVMSICATTPGTTCIDIFTMLAADPLRYFIPGDLHPNAAAHALIAEQIELRTVPEPSTASLMALGLAWIAAARRRYGAAGRLGRRTRMIASGLPCGFA